MSLVTSKHAEFSKCVNQIASTRPGKKEAKSREKLLKNIGDILTNATEADQHLVDPAVARRFPIEHQYTRFLFFKGKKKKSIDYVTTLCNIDTVDYWYKVLGTPVLDKARSNTKVKYYTTTGEAKIKAINKASKNKKSKTKRIVTSEVKNVLTMTWQVNPKNKKIKIDAINGEPVDFFANEISELEKSAKLLVEKYYEKLPEKKAIPELIAPTVQNEFSPFNKSVPFDRMFDGSDSYIKIIDLEVTPGPVAKYEDEAIVITDAQRQAYFDQEDAHGNRLLLRFAVAFDNELKNGRIVKVEYISGDGEEPVKAPSISPREAKNAGNYFVQKLMEYMRTGATNKDLEEELLNLFETAEAVIETSSIRRATITPHTPNSYLTGLNRVIQGKYSGKVVQVEALVSEPIIYSNSNIVEIKFKQLFNMGKKYCDKTEKNVQMFYDKGKYLVKSVTLSDGGTKECKPGINSVAEE